MITFKQVKYIPGKHTFSKIYERYPQIHEVSYSVFKTLCKRGILELIYDNDVEIGLLCHEYLIEKLFVYIHYLVITRSLNIKKLLYNYFMSKGYFIIGVGYYSIKHKKEKIIRIKH